MIPDAAMTPDSRVVRRWASWPGWFRHLQTPCVRWLQKSYCCVPTQQLDLKDRKSSVEVFCRTIARSMCVLAARVW